MRQAAHPHLAHPAPHLMTQTMIHLLPEEVQPERHSRSPYHRAIHWLSPIEERKGLKTNVDIFMTQKAFIRVSAQAGSDLDNEVGGWLAGKHRRDKLTGREYIVIEKILPAQKTHYSSTHFTFTQDSIVELHQVLEADFPGKELVGWYHSHPRMGIFLSGWDEWLHRNFFPEAWHVALVIEPHSSMGGFFIIQGGELDSHRYYGFYELTNGKERSVVYWKNLKLAEGVEK